MPALPHVTEALQKREAVLEIKLTHSLIRPWRRGDEASLVWGRGTMTEAVRAMTEHAFQNAEVHRLYACLYASSSCRGQNRRRREHSSD
jgi:hypothetical protein